MKFLELRAKTFQLIIAIILVPFLGVIDYLTGPELAFSIFYLAPVSLGVWYVGRGAGIGISIASAVTWLVADLMWSKIYPHPLIPYWNALVRLGFFLIITYILAAMKRSLENERTMARTDPLTMAGNGRYFAELVDLEINRARRYEHPFTVAYIDVDNFKFVNDHFGHGAGDLLLRSVAETIQKNIRGMDVIARIGGDEFAILLPETGVGPAQGVVRRIQESVAAVAEGKGWPVTLSVGVITYLAPPGSYEEVVRMADERMYAAKKNGKNRIESQVWGQ
jgi:diguanylate cyclase (GGDEF)-like protein